MWRFLGWAAVVAAALYFLYIVRASLIPFLIGGVIALLLNPFVDALCRKGYSRGRAIVNVFLAFLLFTLGLGLMLAPAFYAQSQEIIQTFNRRGNGDLNKTIESFVQQARDYLDREIPKRREWIERNQELLKRLDLPTEPNELAAALTTRLQQRANSFLLDNAARYINSFLNTLLELLSKAIWIILIPMSAYFFLMDMPALQRGFLFMIPPEHRAAVRQLLSEIGALFFRYIRGMAVASLSYGAICMAYYWLAGAPNPVLLGVLAAILYPIPYLGSFLIALSAFGVTLLFGPSHPAFYLFTLTNFWHAALVVAGALVINNVFDLLVTPRLLGGAVGLRPLGALIAIVVGANWGIWGMLLAVPVATTLKIVIERLLHFFYGEADFLALPQQPAGSASDGAASAEPVQESVHAATD
ncbi:MAG: AI-2E family transporter [Fimbriimonadales bacterium]|nr:MAG: AI-2E family transporter [Fimbriimonadales bacterium]